MGITKESQSDLENSITVIVPCFNEVDAIRHTIEDLRLCVAECGLVEIIVVDDGSVDGSREILDEMSAEDPLLVVVHHERNSGYGASLKSGIDRARGTFVAITDADGTYPHARFPELIGLARTVDMVVGARVGEDVTYPLIRRIPKWFLRHYASWISRKNIPDINSGMRVMRKKSLERFIGILPDGFSFTTTITIAMLLNRLEVRYVPISYSPRIGRSKIRPVRDTLRFFALILRTGTYFAPMRVFMPIAGLLAAGATASFAYDVFVLNNLTDKTTLLFLFAVNAGMFSLLADMIDKRNAR